VLLVLNVTRLKLVRVYCNDWQIFAILVLEADLPTHKKIGPGLDIGQCWILAWSFQLPCNHILEAIVRDDVMGSALVLDRYGLLHQTAFFELVAVDQRTTETSLLVGGQILGKIGVNLSHWLGR
jgi:hypothetical protein